MPQVFNSAATFSDFIKDAPDNECFLLLSGLSWIFLTQTSCHICGTQSNNYLLIQSQAIQLKVMGLKEEILGQKVSPFWSFLPLFKKHLNHFRYVDALGNSIVLIA